ncbi:hypothetical protein [Bradyrhizobium sp. MOS002]|uniref:hypothetical protein n=1 Tax=Bradyrhizobium sp. MOS002 TaxID=2133947 RepID=UPI000D1376CA|nr:hypothetical protein [Bradyrhizobium sp. MOS002]PSO25204.1 hypothetical protein C7G41_30310 [Bradyrhizobium sp. MOS002]
MFEERIALIALLVLAAWLFVGLPIIYLPSESVSQVVTKAPMFAPIFTTIIALFALIVASRQLALNRQNQRETLATATFREFLKLCIQYPDLASGEPSTEHDERYPWFVAHFLWAAEDVLEYAADAWEQNLSLYVEDHREYLENDTEFREKDFPTYSPKLRSFINKTLATLRANDMGTRTQ